MNQQRVREIKELLVESMTVLEHGQISGMWRDQSAKLVLKLEKAIWDLSARQEAAPGWVKVPIEPTRKMLDAAEHYDEQLHPLSDDCAIYGGIYKAMLEAAPQERE